MKVRVFRNLHRAAWSLRVKTQGAWRTVAHVQSVTVADAKFTASEKCRLRCLAARTREVHGWVEGELIAVADVNFVMKWLGTEAFNTLRDALVFRSEIPDRLRGVCYRPFEASGFRLRDSGEVILAAPRVTCTMTGECTVD